MSRLHDSRAAFSFRSAREHPVSPHSRLRTVRRSAGAAAIRAALRISFEEQLKPGESGWRYNSSIDRLSFLIEMGMDH